MNSMLSLKKKKSSMAEILQQAIDKKVHTQ